MSDNQDVMSALKQGHCAPCEGGMPPLQTQEINELMPALHDDWQCSEDKKSIEREFRFKNFYDTMAFVNALAWIAHREDHHPDLEVGFNRCLVRYSTHAIEGLSRNDFVCAARADALMT